MATLAQSFEGGTADTEISASNTTGGGNAITSIKGNGASVAFTATSGDVINGSMSCKCYGPSGSVAYVNWSASSVTTGGMFTKFRLSPVSAVTAIQIIRTTNGPSAEAQLLTNNKVLFSSPAGTTLYTTSALTLPGVYWIDMALDTGSSSTDGKAKFAIYDSAGNLAGGMSSPQEFTGINAGSGGTLTYFQAGKCSTSTDSSNYIVDDMRAVSGAYSFANTGGNVAPTANAGANQTAIEPWTTVTLNASASTDSDGTIVSYNWRQISGTSVTLQGSGPTRTYTAPGTLNGDTLVFGCIVTDNQGAQSTENTVSHTVLYATERAIIGGVEVPMRIDEV